MKNIYIILGNGFTIDFLKNVSKSIPHDIDVTNLFKNGEKVPWPGSQQMGFLSYKHCPNIWNLGARHNSTPAQAIELIEDIITCANILQRDNRGEPNIYINAYKELTSYLYSLFAYYNERLNIPNLDLQGWGWSEYFERLNKNPEIGKVHIVTYNYDIWLERILQKLSIPFDIVGFQPNQNNKFQIYKPHGSISFIHAVSKVVEDYKIDYDLDVNDGDISEFTVRYSGFDGLNKLNALIPPAGDSNRLDWKWASYIREETKNQAKLLTKEDEFILCGISYWHVDRLEIDAILTSINNEISNVKVINPNPPRVLNAVMTTLFKNVLNFNNSDSLI